MTDITDLEAQIETLAKVSESIHGEVGISIRLPINDDVPRGFIEIGEDEDSKIYQRIIDADQGKPVKTITLTIKN